MDGSASQPNTPRFHLFCLICSISHQIRSFRGWITKDLCPGFSILLSVSWGKELWQDDLALPLYCLPSRIPEVVFDLCNAHVVSLVASVEAGQAICDNPS